MSSENPVLIGWDIDGTLIRPLGTAKRFSGQFHEAIAVVVGRECALRIDTHGMTDRQIVTELLASMGEGEGAVEGVLAQMDRQILALGEGELEVEGIGGASEAMALAEELGHINALLTGNTPVRAATKVAAGGYDLELFDWVRSSFGNTSVRRSDLVVALRERATREGGVALVIGDTPMDAWAAQAGGVAFCGVATGAYDVTALAAEEHRLVVSDFVSGGELLCELLELLAGTRQVGSP